MRSNDAITVVVRTKRDVHNPNVQNEATVSLGEFFELTRDFVAMAAANRELKEDVEELVSQVIRLANENADLKNAAQRF